MPGAADRAEEDKISTLYQNFIPISLLAVIVPVAVMGVSSYFKSESNGEKIEVLRQDRQKFDLRLADKVTVIDNKLDRLSVVLERVDAQLDALDDRVSEIRSEQMRRTQKVYTK